MEADAKDMGGHLSHEYHYVTSIGEQKLQTCSECNETSVDNTENEDEQSKCPKCNADTVERISGIEVSSLKFTENLLDIKKINFSFKQYRKDKFEYCMLLTGSWKERKNNNNVQNFDR